MLRTLFRDVLRTLFRTNRLSAIAAAAVLAVAGGTLFHALGLPAAWLTGAMMAVAAGAMLRVPVHLPAFVGTGSFLLLGISMGAGVTPDTLRQAAAWPLSMLLLAVSVVACIAVCSLWLERVHRWDRATARFASIPGALGAVLVMAAASHASLPRVALAQSVRLFTLVAAMPWILQWLPAPPVPAVTATAANGLADMALLLGTAAASGALLHRLRFPGGVLMGAMLASAALHGTGVVEGALPAPVQAAGFVAIGAVIGSRFGGVTPAALLGALRPSLESVGLALLVSAACAGVASVLLGLPVGQLWLAYAPGGIEAMSIVAFVLGFDVAFVGIHHVVRFAGIGLLVPWWQMRWRTAGSCGAPAE